MNGRFPFYDQRGVTEAQHGVVLFGHTLIVHDTSFVDHIYEYTIL
jgi:hypothetical protein